MRHMNEIDLKYCITRRTTLLAGCGLLLSACSDSTLGTISESVRHLATDPEDTSIPRARIDSIPYATMSAKFGRNPRALTVLRRVDNKELYWFAGNQIVLVTRAGRLVRTAGLPANLKRTWIMDDDPLGTLQDGVHPTDSYRRLVDLGPPDRYGIMVTSQLESVGPASVVISELQFETQLWRERNTAREFDWSYENRYWVDPDNGLLWKSIQHVHPDLPPVELEVLKPAAV